MEEVFKINPANIKELLLFNRDVHKIDRSKSLSSDAKSLLFEYLCNLSSEKSIIPCILDNKECNDLIQMYTSKSIRALYSDCDSLEINGRFSHLSEFEKLNPRKRQALIRYIDTYSVGEEDLNEYQALIKEMILKEGGALIKTFNEVYEPRLYIAEYDYIYFNYMIYEVLGLHNDDINYINSSAISYISLYLTCNGEIEIIILKKDKKKKIVRQFIDDREIVDFLKKVVPRGMSLREAIMI